MDEHKPMLIQKLRLQAGWSQEQLAALAGLSTRTIQRVERGQQPSVETLKALGAVFDLDFNTLRETDMTVPASPNHGQQEALALLHVRKVKGFYVHLAQYCIVVAILAVFNLVETPRYFWAGWVGLGWGSGVAVHGLRVFDKIPFLGAAWEKRQVERYLRRSL